MQCLLEEIQGTRYCMYTPDRHKMKNDLRGFLAQGKEAGSAHSRELCAGSADAALRQKDRKAASFYVGREYINGIMSLGLCFS